VANKKIKGRLKQPFSSLITLLQRVKFDGRYIYHNQGKPDESASFCRSLDIPLGETFAGNRALADGFDVIWKFFALVKHP